MLRRAAALALVFLPGATALRASPASAGEAPSPDLEAALKDLLARKPEILEEALRARPEMIENAILAGRRRQAELQREAATRALETRAAEIFDAPDVASEGPLAKPVVLVEFLDYACIHCKNAAADVERLGNDGFRVQHRHRAFLRPDSMKAARAAIAAARQDHDAYVRFHHTMMAFKDGAYDDGVISRLASAAGLDVARLLREAADPETARRLSVNETLARELNANGTPTFVTRKSMHPGAIGYTALRSAIDAAAR